MNLETLYYNALHSGDVLEAARLLRLLERLDSQRTSYGKAQRGEA